MYIDCPSFMAWAMLCLRGQPQNSLPRWVFLWRVAGQIIFMHSFPVICNIPNIRLIFFCLKIKIERPFQTLHFYYFGCFFFPCDAKKNQQQKTPNHIFILHFNDSCLLIAPTRSYNNCSDRGINPFEILSSNWLLRIISFFFGKKEAGGEGGGGTCKKKKRKPEHRTPNAENIVGVFFYL